MENNVYQLFFSDLFLSGAVYGFKQNNDDTKIAAYAEGWHLNCPEPSHSPPLPSPDVSHCSSPPSMIGAKEDAQVLRQMPGMWNQACCFMALFYFFFLFGPCPFPLCRPSGSTHVFASLSFLLLMFCAFVLKLECPCCTVCHVEFLQRNILGTGIFSIHWGGQKVSTTSCLPKKLGETDGSDVWSIRN